MKDMLISKSKTKRLTVILSSIAALALIVGFTVYEFTKHTVTLDLDGKQETIRTHASTIADILAIYDIQVRDEDYLSHALNTEINGDLSFQWKASVPVTLALDGETRSIWTAADTVESMLQAEKIAIKDHDEVIPPLLTKIEKDMTISVKAAFEVTLQDGLDEEKHVWSTSITVADFLKQQEITLQEYDRVEPALDELVTKDATVQIVRVEKVTDVVEEPVDYAVVTKKDSSLDKGKERVLEQGTKGIVAKYYEVFLENGQEVSRELIKTEEIQKSKDRVVAVGTKVLQPVSRGSSEVVEEFYVTATAYTAYCTGCSGITTTGINLRANPDLKVIAVDPSIIPLGTKVYVEGYGYAIAGDIGSAIKGYKIDVFIPDKSRAYRWGVRKVKIKILD
ncbi:DUF348 domain-containing protein [Bacillus sp. HMF5848]|uniref:G5 and 3D domain-containing protein n=1 Tax=Bacillus sp. HMF5848 TaxID=2495421 RepID=UPI000F79B71C|nr:DUF348 domain-containing protein [Bacillus sp. HMF5848]